jgi:hypothetical protein
MNVVEPFFVLFYYVSLRFEFRIVMYLRYKVVRFVFTSSCLYEGSCLIYVICVCLRMMVSNTYFVVFLLCVSSSCILCTLSCQFLWIVPSVFDGVDVAVIVW